MHPILEYLFLTEDSILCKGSRDFWGISLQRWNFHGGRLSCHDRGIINVRRAMGLVMPREERRFHFTMIQMGEPMGSKDFTLP